MARLFSSAGRSSSRGAHIMISILAGLPVVAGHYAVPHGLSQE